MSRTTLCLHPYCTASIKIILDFGGFGLQVSLARRLSNSFVVSCLLCLELKVCPYRLIGALFKREHLACLLSIVFYYRHCTISNSLLMWRSSSRTFSFKMSKRRSASKRHFPFSYIDMYSEQHGHHTLVPLRCHVEPLASRSGRALVSSPHIHRST
jgi:hypothetical protein